MKHYGHTLKDDNKIILPNSMFIDHIQENGFFHCNVTIFLHCYCIYSRYYIQPVVFHGNLSLLIINTIYYYTKLLTIFTNTVSAISFVIANISRHE